MINKLFILGLALTGSALAGTAYFMRRSSRHQDAQEHKEDLRTWEGEGGKPAAARPAPARASTAR